MRSATCPSVVPRNPRALNTSPAARTISRRRSTYSGRPSPSAAARRRAMLLVVVSWATRASLRQFVRARHKPSADEPPRPSGSGRKYPLPGALDARCALGTGEERRRDQLALGERTARLGGDLGGRRDFADLREGVLMMRGDQPCVHVGPNLLISHRTVKRKFGFFGTTIVQKLELA